MSTKYTYGLDKSSKKYTCPSCDKKTFTKYKNLETGEYCPDEFGRCDRENNCPYHKHPKDADKPLTFDTSKPKKELPPAKLVTPEPDYINKVRGRLNTPFHDFCRHLSIPNEHLQQWAVGGNYEKTAFVQIKPDGTAVNIKFVPYGADGHRLKGDKQFPYHLGKGYLKNRGLLTPEQEKGDWQDYYSFERCFYGAHLWNSERDTCLVESEKSAVLGAFFFPAYNWLATGGASGMKYDQFSLFTGYKGKIHNLVDNDTAGAQKSKTVEWLRKLAQMRDNPEEIRSLNLFKNRPVGWDIADAIVKDGYRDTNTFAADLKHTLDISLKEEINLETGEVNIVPATDKPHYTEKELRRAKQVAQRIWEAKQNIMPDLEAYRKLCRACASFGEEGRKLWKKMYPFYQGDIKEEESEEHFNKILPSAALATSKELFELAETAGIYTKLVRTKRGEAAEGADGEEDPDTWAFFMPDNKEASDEIRAHVFKYRFLEYKNCYYFAKFHIDSKTVKFSQESNFIIKPLFLIRSKTDPKRLYEIVNTFGHKLIIDVPAKAMVSLTEFQVFVESQGNFLFQGNKTHFTLIKSKLYDNTQEAEEIKTLGWHRDGFYAFSNGIFNSKFTEINEHGIIKHLIDTGEDEAEERHYFLPAMSSIYKDEDDLFENEKKFVFTKRDDIRFKEWAKLFTDCYGENGVFGLCFYISSLFRDLIYSRYKFFPHLFLFGPPGTGKSTMAWSIQYMFGLERRPFMLNAGTAVGFHRTFSQFKNAVVWFDEYNNSIDPKRVQDLKGAYDGAGHVKGEWSSAGGSSNRTTSTPVHSTCIVSGQELPTADNALFKRVILLQHYQTQFNDEESARLEKLKGIQEKGMSHITGNLMRFRKKMEEEYYETFVQVQSELKEALARDSSIEDRIVQNACMVATTFKILENDLPWPFDWEELKRTFTLNIMSQNNLISNAKETNQFWDVVDFLISEGDMKEGQDFKVEWKYNIKVMVDREMVEKTLEDYQPVFFFRLQTAYPMFMKAVRNMGEKKGMDKGSLKHYLKHSKGYIGEIKSTNFKDQESGKNFQTNAYAFQLNVLEEQGYNFNRYQDEDGRPDDGPVGTDDKADF
jgi:hypothetical protein